MPQGSVPEQRLKVFISYSRADSAFADELVDGLEYDGGFEVLIDRHSISEGEDWKKRLGALIMGCDTVVFVLSPDSAKSPICAWEVDEAVRLSKRVIPVMWRPLGAEKAPEKLAALNYVRFDDGRSFIAGLRPLASALKTDVGWLREHTRQAELAARWLERGRPESLLLRGDTLDVCKAWVGRRKPDAPEITEAQRAFFNASEEGESSRLKGERERLDQMSAAQAEREKALQQAQAALRKGQRALRAAGVLFACLVVGAIGVANQNVIKEQWFKFRYVRPYVLTEAKERALKPLGPSFKECALACPEMIVVPAGEFLMGSPEGKGDKGEQPQHKVGIARPFAVGKFSVTFDEWDLCVSLGGCKNPASDLGWGRGRRPVINVSWTDVHEYVAWLSVLTGQTYRLLSEAEWEYAARAGTTTLFSFGDEESTFGDYAWYSQNSDSETHPVGEKKPNPFGLHDIHGNVWQWVEDALHSNYFFNYDGAPTDGSVWKSADTSTRVLRGGDWSVLPVDLRSARRYLHRPDHRSVGVGFRVARTLLAP